MSVEEILEREYIVTMSMFDPNNYVSDGNGGITFIENIMSEDEREVWEYHRFLESHQYVPGIDEIGF